MAKCYSHSALNCLLVYLVCWRGTQAAFMSSVTCEAELVSITNSNGTFQSSQREVVSSSSLNNIVVTDTLTITTIYNTTEIGEAWDYYSTALPASGTESHTQATAQKHCQKVWSTGILREVINRVITLCGYTTVNVNAAPFYRALFRMETECTRDTDGVYCVPPAGLTRMLGDWSTSTATTVDMTDAIAVTTTVAHYYTHIWHWGNLSTGGSLVKTICPQTCQTGDGAETCTALPSASAYCCNTVWINGMKNVLGVGPVSWCESPRDLPATCLAEPAALLEITSAAGGTVSLRRGASLEVPPTALASSGCIDPCPILLEAVPEITASDAVGLLSVFNPDWTDIRQLSRFYDYQPSGLQFSRPVKACMEAVEEPASLDEVEIYQFTTDTNERIGDQLIAFEEGGVSYPITYDSTTNLLCFYTKHFSRFGAYRKTAPGSDQSTYVIVEETTPSPGINVIPGGDDGDGIDVALVVGITVGCGVGLLLCLGFCFLYSKQQEKDINAASATKSTAGQDSMNRSLESPRPRPSSSPTYRPAPVVAPPQLPSTFAPVPPPNYLQADFVAMPQQMQAPVYRSSSGQMPPSFPAPGAYGSPYASRA